MEDFFKRQSNMRISHKEFEDAVERALEMIPEMFRAQLNNMTIAVEDIPSRDLLREMDVPPGETLFGVFTGVPLPERSVTEPPLYPDVILIFREPLMAACHSYEELEEEIAITVVHELAHYLGLSEERLEELGYG
jgi:predicted Zn-dependent protease with MMP-like domain